MNDSPILACDGVEAGGLIVPPFEVGPGEIVKLVFPSSTDMHSAERLIVEEANCDGRAAIVELAMQPSRWREMLHRQTTAEWLIKKCGMTHGEAVERLDRVQIRPDSPLCGLAGNPRWMLGFLAAVYERPAVLVFSTTGCDPVGIQKALDTVRSQLRDAAGVYLSCHSNLQIAEPEYASVLQVEPPPGKAA